jgi:hypothetical protein
MFSWALTAYAKAEKAIRTRIASYIRSISPDPKPTIRKIILEWQNKTSTSMLMHAYDAAQEILNLNTVKNGLADKTNDSDFYLTRSKNIMKFRDQLEEFPATDKHLEMLRSLTDLFSRIHVDQDDAMSLSDFYDEFQSTVSTYYGSAIEDEYATDPPDAIAPDRTWARPAWLIRSPDQNIYASPSGTPNYETEHIEAIAAYVNELTHNQVPDEAVIFALTPSFKSSGYHFFYEDLLTYVHHMPLRWYTHNRDEIWELRMQNKFEDDQDYYDPADIDSTYLETLETTELDDMPIVPEDEHAPKGTTEPKSSRPPMDETSRSKDQKTKNQKKKEKTSPKGQSAPDHDDPSSSTSPPPPPPPQGTPQPQIPDDTSYVPDPFLSRKARDITRYFQGLADMDMIHDHMTRFDTTVEQPFPMTRWQVRKTDSRTFAGQSTMSRMYVITYTRQSRKPIFNPVD